MNVITISLLSKEMGMHDQYELSFGDYEVIVCFTTYRCLEIICGKL
jgi:hypothetical protein